MVTAPTAEQLAGWYGDWEEAVVVWDGVEYPVPAQYYSGVMKCIGDMSLITGGASTGEPFIIALGDASIMGADTCMIYSLLDDAPEDAANAGAIYHTVAMRIVTKKIHPLDPKFIESVPWDKVTDRPFGLVPARTIVAQVDATFTIEDDGAFMAICNLDMLEPNKKYIVSWDGSEFVLTSQVASNNKNTFALITGNTMFFTGAGVDTGEPFAIYQFYESGALFTYVASNAV